MKCYTYRLAASNAQSCFLSSLNGNLDDRTKFMRHTGSMLISPLKCSPSKSYNLRYFAWNRQKKSIITSAWARKTMFLFKKKRDVKSITPPIMLPMPSRWRLLLCAILGFRQPLMAIRLYTDTFQQQSDSSKRPFKLRRVSSRWRGLNCMQEIFCEEKCGHIYFLKSLLFIVLFAKN